MIDRLRKDLNDVGSYNPGMADGGPVSHDDQAQDAEMIKSVLQKIVDEMNGLEADRIMPAHKKPGYAAGSMGVESPNENKAETMQEAEPENPEPELDSDVLKSLLDKAGEADETGKLPEDDMADLPPAIADAVRRKKMPK